MKFKNENIKIGLDAITRKFKIELIASEGTSREITALRLENFKEGVYAMLELEEIRELEKLVDKKRLTITDFHYISRENIDNKKSYLKYLNNIRGGLL